MNSKFQINHGSGKLTRKKFFEKLSFLLFLPFAFLWVSEISRIRKPENTPLKIKIPESLPAGIHFFDKVLIVKTESTIKVFKAKCTHLGCKLSKIENNEIICPCHGSRFSSEGYVISGPANKKLQEFSFSLNDSGELIIDETDLN